MCVCVSAYRLIYDAYSKTGLMEPNPYEMRVTPHDLLHTTGRQVAPVGRSNPWRENKIFTASSAERQGRSQRGCYRTRKINRSRWSLEFLARQQDSRR